MPRVHARLGVTGVRAYAEDWPGQDAPRASLPAGWRCSHTANRVEQFAPGIGFAKMAGTLARHRLLERLRVVVRGDKENRRCNSLCRQFIPQIDPGYSRQLDVEHEAVKSWLLHICAEIFGTCVCDRLHPRGAQESSDRAAKTLVIVHDTYIKFTQDASCHSIKPIGYTPIGLLPFRAVNRSRCLLVHQRP